MKSEKNSNEKSNNKLLNKLLITISQEGKDDELFNILNGSSKLPFKLPNHVVFPSGKKEFARRARMLMLAGMDFLKEKYPDLDINNTEIKPVANKTKEVIEEKKEELVVF